MVIYVKFNPRVEFLFLFVGMLGITCFGYVHCCYRFFFFQVKCRSVRIKETVLWCKIWKKKISDISWLREGGKMEVQRETCGVLREKALAWVRRLKALPCAGRREHCFAHTESLGLAHMESREECFQIGWILLAATVLEASLASVLLLLGPKDNFA